MTAISIRPFYKQSTDQALIEQVTRGKKRKKVYLRSNVKGIADLNVVFAKLVC